MPAKQRSQSPNYGWVRMTPKEVIAFSAENKQAIKAKLDQIIEQDMKPEVLKVRGGRQGFGVVEDLYTRWHGDSLSLIAKRRGGELMGEGQELFETKHGRITITGADTFAVAYFRHTDRWFTILSECNLKTALDMFRKPSPVCPGRNSSNLTMEDKLFEELMGSVSEGGAILRGDQTPSRAFAGNGSQIIPLSALTFTPLSQALPAFPAPAR